MQWWPAARYHQRHSSRPLLQLRTQLLVAGSAGQGIQWTPYPRSLAYYHPWRQLEASWYVELQYDASLLRQCTFIQVSILYPGTIYVHVLPSLRYRFVFWPDVHSRQWNPDGCHICGAYIHWLYWVPHVCNNVFFLFENGIPKLIWPSRCRSDGCDTGMPLCTPQSSFEAYIEASGHRYRRSRPAYTFRSIVCLLLGSLASAARPTPSVQLSISLSTWLITVSSV